MRSDSPAPWKQLQDLLQRLPARLRGRGGADDLGRHAAAVCTVADSRGGEQRASSV
ncbi:MAG: hypothetical protein MZV49_15240 [Rhodopseudomonas palustris]|nr:hypothetical protein [Rhodopseudomonas palustris]